VVRALLQAITIGMTAAALNAKTRNLAREPADEPDDSGRPASMLLRAGGAAFGLFRSAASESAVAKLARDRDRALADARDHTVDLVHALGQTIELDPQRSGFLASASAFTLELAKRLSGADFRDLADAGVRAVASSSSDELIKMVIGLHMDVSGRDLSSLSGTEQDNLNALYGVTWNEATIWPPAWAGSVHQWSHEVRPGVHRIYRSSVRNLAASVLEATRATEVGH
jgi:hypothetical protein